MVVFSVHSNKDFLGVLEYLEKETGVFFNTPGSTPDSLSPVTVELHTSLEFNEAMCQKLASLFRYFRGEFRGNNYTIVVCSHYPVVLFSSVYNSKIQDLRIRNIFGSHGLLLADDITNSTINNIHLSGSISLKGSMGGLARTMTGCTVIDCQVTDFKTRCELSGSEDSYTEDPISFGAITYSALGGTQFRDCSVSGELVAEVGVGGLCAKGVGVEVHNCNFTELNLTGKRDLGMVAGILEKSNRVENCLFTSSKLSGSIHVGSVCGRVSGTLVASDLYVEDILLSNTNTSFFVGGVAGKADTLEICNSQLDVNVTANFVLAGICPDVRKADIRSNKVRGVLVCLGYPPMMHQVFELVKDKEFTSEGEEIAVVLEDNDCYVVVREMDNEGPTNPFKVGIL